jgi:hypothetical protein
MIREFFERRRLARQLAGYLDPAKVESIVRDGLPDHSLKAGHLEFVIAFIRGDGPDQISERMGRVAELASAHNAMVDQLVSGLVIVVFGVHPGLPSKPEDRPSLVQALREQLAGDVKIVHGGGDGHYGLFGNNNRMSYTFLVPDFDRILGTLSQLKFGETKEVEK